MFLFEEDESQRLVSRARSLREAVMADSARSSSLLDKVDNRIKRLRFQSRAIQRATGGLWQRRAIAIYMGGAA